MMLGEDFTLPFSTLIYFMLLELNTAVERCFSSAFKAKL